jgi:hypothetical protein
MVMIAYILIAARLKAACLRFFNSKTILKCLICLLLVATCPIFGHTSDVNPNDADTDIHPLMRDDSDAENSPIKEETGKSLTPPIKDDSRKKYKWLFREREPQQSDSSDPSVGQLEKLDRLVKQARKLYIGGEKENSILQYRNALDHPLVAQL